MSNVIKAAKYTTVEETKQIDAKPPVAVPEPARPAPEQGEEARLQRQIAAAEQTRKSILADAEQAAERLLQEASQEADGMLSQAREEIEAWWQERRKDDVKAAEQAKSKGFEQGRREGTAAAEKSVRGEYADMIDEARAIVEQAVQTKQQIILESEPFLIELSCAIAEKIVARQLTVEPEWIVALIKSVLNRRREHGVITLCVSPAQFAFIQHARDELALAIDAQAELQIVADLSVTDHGCVIRSAFGSLDATIDTQLSEIKTALKQIAVRSQEESRHE